MDVHLRDLRYFAAVAEELHFGRAAQRLFVSQPALSRQIAKLERDLGTTLFVRDRRSVTLTAAGAELASRTGALLGEWDDVRRAVGERAAADAAVVRVGLQTSIGRGIVARLQAVLAQRNPLARLELVAVDWDDPSVGLVDRRVDIALGWLPVPGSALVTTTVLSEEACLVAVAAGHPLAGRTSVEFAEIESEAFVALPDDAGPLRDFWLAADRRRRPARIAAIARNAEEALEAVAAGLGVVLLSRGNAELYRRDHIATLEVTDLPPARLALLTRADERGAVIRHLVGDAVLSAGVRPAH